MHCPSPFENLTGSSSFPDIKHMVAGKKGALEKYIQGICSAESSGRYLLSELITKLAHLWYWGAPGHWRCAFPVRFLMLLVSSHLSAWGFAFGILFFSKMRGLFFFKPKLQCHDVLICIIAVYPEVSPAVSITRFTSIKLLNSCPKLAHNTANSHSYPALPESWLHHPRETAEWKAVWSQVG